MFTRRIMKKHWKQSDKFWGKGQKGWQGKYNRKIQRGLWHMSCG